MRTRKSDGRFKAIRRAMRFARALITLILFSCAFDNWNYDLEDFVDRGTSLIRIASYSYAQDGKAIDADVERGLPVTVNIRFINPKALDIAYALSCDQSLVAEGSLSQIPNTTGAVDGFTETSFSFTPSAMADHGTIAFTVGMRSPSINRDYPKGTISVNCDSPPDPVNNLVAGIRSNGQACIGFTLPEDYPNEDIAAVRITYSSPSIGTNRAVTEDVSIDGTNLTIVPDPALLDSTTGAYIRYFIPDDVVAGNPYTFTVVSIDGSGKESTVPSDPASVGVTGTEVILSFDPNGATGTVGARFGLNTSTTVIPSAEGLTYDDRVFMGWNTAANGSGTAYMPNDTYTFTTSNTTLYAQWLEIGIVQITILNPDYATLGFSKNGFAITSTVIDCNGSLPLSFASGIAAADYQWYRDGSAIAGATTAAYSFVPNDVPITSGTCVISVTATVDGVAYSGNLTVLVTDDYMVTILPKGQEATYDQTTWTTGSGIDSPRSFAHTLTRAYQLGRYEVSHKLWTEVRTWGLTAGYNDLRVGVQGHGGTPTPEHPVTEVSDLDAMIWCNAYSEMTGATPCYYADTEHTTVLRTTAALNAIAAYSSAYVDWTANGYRLPTHGEWHYAASCGGYYAYDHVSGCSTQDYSGSDSANYANVRTGVTVPVNAKEPNIWGLHNMSGNVWEYSFDRYQESAPSTARIDYVNDTGTMRTTGGSTYATTHDSSMSSVGFRIGTTIFGGDIDDGFRIARSIP